MLKKTTIVTTMIFILYFFVSCGTQTTLVKDDTSPQKNILSTHEIVPITTHDNVQFEGKLRLPINDTINTLIIYVNGSGPNTYDNTRSLGEGATFNYHDLFAEQVTASGGAYFSYNTRGVTIADQPPLYAAIDNELYQTYIPSNEIQDIEAIIRTLMRDKRLAEAKVYLLGWSAGTIIAPQVALRGNVHVDGLLLAGYCNQTMEAILDWQQTGGSSMVHMAGWFDYDQNDSISKDEYETDTYNIAKHLGPFEMFDINQDNSINREDFRMMLAGSRDVLYNAINRGDDQWLKENYGVQLTSAWFLDYRTIPPNSETLAKLDLPIYIFQGEKDANTPVQDSYDAEEGQRKAGKNNVRLAVFGGHDHDLNYIKYAVNKTLSKGLHTLFTVIDTL